MARVNGSMLNENIGKLVCVVGKITQVSPTGNALKILTSDQQTIQVSLKDQYEDTPGHCIQIIGIVQQNLSVIAEKYTSFASEEFDLALYDKTIKLLPRYSELFLAKAGGADTNDPMEDW